MMLPGTEVVAAFTTPFEAEVARGRMADAEIPATVLDGDIVTSDWSMSVAVGGVKLAVLTEDAELARAVLAAPAASDDESESGTFEPPTAAEDLSWRAFVAMLLGAIFPPVYVYAAVLLARYRGADGKTPRTRRRVIWALVIGGPLAAFWAGLALHELGLTLWFSSL